MMKNLTILLLIIPTIAFAQYRFENGMFPEIVHERTGHFYLTNHNGRNLLITPNGIGFYPIGINHLNAVFSNKIGREEVDIKKDVVNHMDEYGFNCGGYGTGSKLTDEENLFFLGNLNIVKHGFYHLDNVKFPDVFGRAFETHVDVTLKKAKYHYKPEQIIGMVWSDLPAWNIYKSRMLRQTDWVTEIRKLDYSAPGKKAYLDFLKKQYKDNTSELKKYYRLSDDDVNSLEKCDFSKLYLGHPMVMRDDELFMVEIAKRYYELGKRYHDRYFPNTLLFGDRLLLGDHPDGVLQVAAKYVDAISIQIGDGYGETMLPSYPFPGNTLDHIHRTTGKPVLIADHQISFYTDAYKRTIFSQAGDQKECSLETVQFLKSTFAKRYIIGYFRCTYLTQGEPHGRGVKQGIVDFDQVPYSEITKAYSTVNSSISEYILK